MGYGFSSSCGIPGSDTSVVLVVVDTVLLVVVVESSLLLLVVEASLVDCMSVAFSSSLEEKRSVRDAHLPAAGVRIMLFVKTEPRLEHR